MHGTVTLEAEITNVSRHCFWLLLGDEELAVPYAEFPQIDREDSAQCRGCGAEYGGRVAHAPLAVLEDVEEHRDRRPVAGAESRGLLPEQRTKRIRLVRSRFDFISAQ